MSKKYILIICVCFFLLCGCSDRKSVTEVTVFPYTLEETGEYTVRKNTVTLTEETVLLNGQSLFHVQDAEIILEEYGPYDILSVFRRKVTGAYDLAVFDEAGEIVLRQEGVDILTDAEKNTLTVYDPCLVHTEGCEYANQGFRNVTYSLTDMSVLSEAITDYYLEAVKAETLAEGYAWAVCFVNVILEDEMVQQAYEASVFARTAPFMAFIGPDHTIEGNGQGLWCIVPVKPGNTLIVQMDGEEVYRRDDGRAILLQAEMYEAGRTEVLYEGSAGSFSYDPGTEAEEIHVFGTEEDSEDIQAYFDTLYEAVPELEGRKYENYPFLQGLVIGNRTARLIFFPAEDGERQMYAVTDDYMHVYTREYITDTWQEIQ